jgi:ABC-type transporter MlaC component
VIVDIVAEGISMLVTNRSEFDSIVNSRGIEGLLVQMRTWHSGTVPSRAA